MPLSSHFFIESNFITALQTAGTGFGPVTDSQFNITTKFTITADKKAFAICKGIVLVQPQDGSTTKVNLILRPYSQPFPGLDIKYFIYRGLKRSDFFTSDDKIISLSGASDFVTKIRTDFTDYYNSINVTPEPDFLAKYIGFNANETDVPPQTTFISDLFFKEALHTESPAGSGTFTESPNKNFELPMIAEGKWLGNFGTGDCGIDVVLNYGDYKDLYTNQEFVFDLEYARKANAQITPGTGTAMQQKLNREQSTEFIDIAAFYGLFVAGGTVNVTDAGGAVVAKTGTAIYNDLLINFENKNKWYVYIQSDRSRSYNFYDSYKIVDTSTNSLKKGVIATTLVEDSYQTNNWPMLVIDAPQGNTDPKNKLFLQLVTDNNVNTILYGQIGVIENAQQNNFCNADFLRLEPDTSGVYGNLTKIIELSHPRLPDGTMICGITLLLYHGIAYKYQSGTALDENDVEVPVYSEANFFDDVFGLLDSEPLMKLNSETEFSKMTDTKPQLLNHYYDKKQQGISAVQTLVVNDVIVTGIEATPTVARVTYLTEALNILANAVSPTGSMTPDNKTSASAGGTVSKDKTYSLPEPFYYSLQLFSDSTQTITGLLLKATDNSKPGKIILGLTKEENDLLKAIVVTNNTGTLQLLNPRLFLLDLFEDGNELVSPENIKYQKYKIGVVGESVDGTLKLFYPVTDVMVFSLDRLVHFSKGYSEFVKEEEFQSQYLNINKDIE